MQTRSGRVSARSKLGQGARTVHRYRKFPAYTPSISLRDQFGFSESKYFTSLVSSRAMPESQNWADTELDPTTLNTLCVPSEGSDIDERIGRKISVYKIAIRGTISMTTASDQPDILNSPSFRLILYIDQQTNGAQSQGEQVMAPPSPTATVLTAFNSFQNLASLGRFRILRDKTYRGTELAVGTDGANTSSINSIQIPFKMTVKFRNPIIMRFNSTNGGTVADIVDNSFHLIGCKSSTAYDHTIDYQCRTYYKDA